MNTSSRHLLRCAQALVLSLAVSVAPLAAQAPAAAPDSLEITNGSLMREGTSVPATLKNVVDALVLRYPDSNIILAGTADIVIENITVRWGRADKGADLHGVLVALSVASEGKFEVFPSSHASFVLGPARADREVTHPRRVEVIGLASYFLTRDQMAGEAKGAREELGLIKARVSAGLGQQEELQRAERRLELLEQRLAGFVSSPEELITKVNEVSQLAIRQLRGSAAATDDEDVQFQFHPGAKLLIVTGTDEKLAVVHQVVGALTSR